MNMGSYQVYEDNPGSIRLWESMNYIRAGRVPDAKYDANGTPIGAIMFYKNFDKRQS